MTSVILAISYIFRGIRDFFNFVMDAIQLHKKEKEQKEIEKLKEDTQKNIRDNNISDINDKLKF